MVRKILEKAKRKKELSVEELVALLSITDKDELQALYDKGLATAGIDERHQIVWDAIQIHIDHGPFMIGGSGDQQMPVVVRNGFHGIPDLVILGPWAPGSPGNLNTEQFWMEASLRGE